MDEKLSVIIPIFGVDDQGLVRRLGNPLRNSLKEIEFIYVLPEEEPLPVKLADFAKENPEQIRIVTVPVLNGIYSLATARNIGVFHASGDMILFMDVDLIPHRDFYKNIVSFIDKKDMRKQSNSYFPIPAIYLKPGNDEFLRSMENVTSHDELLFGTISSNIDSFNRISSSILMSREFYLRIGGQYEGFEGWGFEDWHFLWKLTSFPMPVPEPNAHKEFSAASPWDKGEYRSWRAAAELLGEESLRANIFLFHAYHSQREGIWKTRKDDNYRLFSRLTSHPRVGINFEQPKSLSKELKEIHIYSDCPSVLNRLFYPPNSRLVVNTPDTLLRKGQGPLMRESRVTRVLGGIDLSHADLVAASTLVRMKVSFNLVYPTSLSRMSLMLHFDGQVFVAKATTREHDTISPEIERVFTMECGGLEYHAAADGFVAEHQLTGKQVVLFHFSSQTIDKDVLDIFGISDPDFRSLLYGVAPLFDDQTVFVMYDPNQKQQVSSPFGNLIDASNRDIEMLYRVSDVVITQSPADVWQAVIRNKPVTTTGTILSSTGFGIKTVASVAETYEWLCQLRNDETVVDHQDALRYMKKISSEFILTAPHTDAPEQLAGTHQRFRVLYTKVNHSLCQANYKFTWDSWERHLSRQVNPVISHEQVVKFHREVEHDYKLIRQKKKNLKVPTKTAGRGIQGSAKNHEPSGSAPSAEHMQQRVNNSPYKAEKRRRLGLVRGEAGTLSRKLRKLRRDPYQYFDDAKSPAVRNLKFLFSR